MLEKVLDIFVSSFSQAIAKDPVKFWIGIAFLGIAMGTIFAGMQGIKRIFKAFRKSQDHGIPVLILIVSPYLIGIGFMFLHGVFFPIFSFAQKIGGGIILGGLNVIFYNIWKWWERRKKKGEK